MNCKYLFCFIFVSLILSCSSSSFITNDVKKSDIINFKYDGHIFFEAKINDLNCILDLDTGGQLLYIDSTFFYKNFYSKNLLDYELKGVGQKTRKIKLYNQLISLKIGKDSINQLITPVLDLQKTSSHPSDGIVGYNFFENKIIFIDYLNKNISFSENLTSLNLKDFKKIPFKIIDSKVVIESTLKLNDTTFFNGKFAIDTGSNNTLNITNDAAKKMNLSKVLEVENLYFSSSMGIGGSSSGSIFKLKMMEISSFRIENFLVDYSFDEAGALSKNTHFDGIIGNKILSKFDLIIDYKSQNIYLRPNNNYNKKNDLDVYEFSIIDISEPCKCWQIYNLYQNSKAKENGLKLNDIITHVDGVSVKRIRKSYLSKRLKKNKSVILNIKRGNEELKIILNSIIHKISQ
jgi:hypothetical protein